MGTPELGEGVASKPLGQISSSSSLLWLWLWLWLLVWPLDKPLRGCLVLVVWGRRGDLRWVRMGLLLLRGKLGGRVVLIVGMLVVFLVVLVLVLVLVLLVLL